MKKNTSGKHVRKAWLLLLALVLALGAAPGLIGAEASYAGMDPKVSALSGSGDDQNLGSKTIDLSSGAYQTTDGNEIVGISVFFYGLWYYEKSVGLEDSGANECVDLDQDGVNDISIAFDETTKVQALTGTKLSGSYTRTLKTATKNALREEGAPYYESITIKFPSKVQDLSKATVTGLSAKTYTGKAITPSPKVVLGGKTLTKGTDYTVKYSNNINVGTATVAITGKGNYTGTVKKTFKITALNLAAEAAKTTVSGLAAKTYTGAALKPVPTVKALVGGSTATLKVDTDYTVTYANHTNAGTAKVTITGKDNFTGTLTKTFTINPASLTGAAVSGIKASYEYTGSAITPVPTVKLGNKALKSGTDYTVTYANHTAAGTATVTITGKGNYTGKITKTFQITKPEPTYTRIYGIDRYATSLAIADELKKELGVAKFSTICVADGVNYPDALAGAYFAYKNQAPIVDIRQNAPTGPQTMNAINYVKNNLKTGGNVYILGGTGSVPESVEASLKKAGFKVTRLWGMNRYTSNLEILKASKIPAGMDFIVATGTDFADALTASATGKPVLLVVGSKLTAEQRAYLAGAGVKSFTILGSTNEVAAEIANELKGFAPVTRIGAVNVYDRSIAVAKKYFPGTQENINLADGRNFPDALCGGPLATKKGGPLFLTDGSAAVNAKIQAYAKAANTNKATIYGGPASVSDETAKYILSVN
ncbi:MAG: cell wall-binding repeat-containing protein [Firmicutes bacterium]|nr:cell wall-binding repeat-containing protein [Bacillota bacterium]